MAVTLDASNIITISDCSSATNWSGSHTLANTVDNYREGTSSNGLLKISDATGWAKFDYLTQNAAAFDMTINSRHLYFWINFAQAHFVTSVKLTAEDASGNIGYWNMSTTFPGGWVSYTVDCARAFDSNNGTDPTRTAISYLGMEIVVVGKVSGNVQNCWIDYLHYAEGPLIVKGGGIGTEGTFEELYTASEGVSTAYGFLGTWEGAVSLKGPIQIGDDGTGDSYFLDQNTTVLGADIPVAADWLKVSTVGNATGTNSFLIGEASGTAGINGCQFKSAGASKVGFDLSDTNMDVMGVFGSSFTDCGDILLPPASATRNFISNSLVGCGVLDANTCKTEAFLIVAPDNFGIKMIPGHAIKNGQLINAPNGVWIEPTADLQEFDLDNVVYTGSDSITYYDVYTNTAHNITVNKINGSNATYDNQAGAGTINIVSSSSITILVQDDAKTPLVTAFVYINDDDTGASEVDTTTDGSGLVSTSYAGAVSLATLRVRKYGYKPFKDTVNISADLDRTITLVADPQQT